MTDLWLLLDERAALGEVDRATVLDTADTETEARAEGRRRVRYEGIWQGPTGELRYDLEPFGLWSLEEWPAQKPAPKGLFDDA